VNCAAFVQLDCDHVAIGRSIFVAIPSIKFLRVSRSILKSSAISDSRLSAATSAKILATGIRVPRTTGMPPLMSGSISIDSLSVVIAKSSFCDSHSSFRILVAIATILRCLGRPPLFQTQIISPFDAQFTSSASSRSLAASMSRPRMNQSRSRWPSTRSTAESSMTVELLSAGRPSAPVRSRSTRPA